MEVPMLVAALALLASLAHADAPADAPRAPVMLDAIPIPAEPPAPDIEVVILRESVRPALDQTLAEEAIPTREPPVLDR